MKWFFLLGWVLFLNGCDSTVGVGLGGVMYNGQTATSTEIYMDEKEGIHGNVTVGSEITL